jgi:hypothetical protein
MMSKGGGILLLHLGVDKRGGQNDTLLFILNKLMTTNNYFGNNNKYY